MEVVQETVTIAAKILIDSGSFNGFPLWNMEGLNRREGPQYLEIFFKDLELSYICKRTLFLKVFKNLLSKLVKALILHLTFVKNSTQSLKEETYIHLCTLSRGKKKEAVLIY